MFYAAISTRTVITTLAHHFLRVALIVCLSTVIAIAQTSSPTDGITPLGITPGSPAGSYALSGFETVNLYNGNLNVRLPLLEIGGRGSARMTMMLAVNSKSWRVKHTLRESPGFFESWVPEQNRWLSQDVGYAPGKFSGRQTGTVVQDCGFGRQIYVHTLTRLTFLAPDGTEYELRDQLTGGKPLPSNCSDIGASRGTIFVTADGTAMTFISDIEIRDVTRPNGFGSFLLSPSGVLFFRDGTRYRIDDGKVSSMRDRNGNQMIFDYDQNGRVIAITDSVNRQVTINYKVSDPLAGLCDQIIYKGVGGAQRIIRIAKYSNLSTAFNPNGSYVRKTPKQLFPELDGSDSTFFDPQVVTSVWLPDGSRRYKFYYNEYGEVERIDLPTGGMIEYKMPQGSGVVSNCFDCDKHIYRRVLERRVYEQASQYPTVSEKTIYAASQSGPLDARPWSTTVTVDQVDPDGALMARSKHYFHGSGLASLFEANGAQVYPIWTEGRQHQAELFDTNGVTMLRRMTETWRQRATVSWWTAWAADHGLDTTNEPANDHRMVETVTRLTDVTPNLVAKKTAINPNNGNIGFDQYNNPTNMWEYDFGAGSAGTLIRRTQTDYLVTHPVTGTNYTDTNIHLRSLPLRQSLFDAGGVERARTIYEYDNYAVDDNHNSLIDRIDISGLAGNFGPSRVTRGNITAVSRWLATTGESLTTYQQYDISGNLVKAIDAEGNIATFDFSDRFGFPDGNARLNSRPTELNGLTSYALPTSVTNPALHTAYTQFDYYTGKPVDGEDANGVVSSGHYNDTLDRPTQVIRAVGTSAQSQTKFAYDDISRILTTTSDLNNYNDNAVKSEDLYDGLGRQIEARQYEPGGYIVRRQEYDAMGRVKRTYNPHRTTNDDTYGWSDSTYDGVSRIKTVQTFDRFGVNTGIVTTSYDSNKATIRDQDKKQRRSLVDGLGRLKQVEELFEHPSTNIYATTTYAYDVLNNLTGMTQQDQSIQTRTFVYDSLSRLIEARNPESGTITYKYDNNGNLTLKTDSRGVVTTYEYDSLNRVKNRSYANDPANTPAVSYIYDAPGVAFSKGRLTRISSSVSVYDYLEYDPVGRIKQSRQTTDNNTYLMSYAYDLSGNMTSETYPSGKIITTSYDIAGRVAGVKNEATGVYYVGGAANDVTNRIQYTPHFAISSMKLGNGLWESAKFNSHFQPTQIRLGSTSTTSEVFQLDYTYGASQSSNNGNVTSQTITASGFSAVQTYSYDLVNRLRVAQENSGSSWKQTFTYDKFGNRRFNVANTTTNVLGPNPTVSQTNNRFSTGQGYDYDASGNLIAEPGKRYEYDGESRLVSLNMGGARYFYDGDGRRVKKEVGNITTLFVYNALGQLIAEYTNPDQPVQGEVVTSYLTSDPLGSTRVVTSQSGTVKSRHDYLPFGEEITPSIGGRNGVFGYNSNDSTRQKFTLYERDDESGLDYAQARYYSSLTGRFTSVDPALRSASQEIPQSLNRYTYVLNNPLAFVDPTGETWLLVQGRLYWTDANIDTAEAQKLYGKTAQVLAPGTHMVFTSGPIAGHEVILNKDRSVRDLGLYQPPPGQDPFKLGKNYGGKAAASFVLTTLKVGLLAGSVGVSSGALLVVAVVAEAELDRKQTQETAVAATTERGGTYILRDPKTGEVMRTGRTNDLDRRRGEHARDHKTAHLVFEVDQRTDVREEQLGREQVIHERHNPPMNKIEPIGANNPNKPTYMKAARTRFRGR